MTHHGWAPRGPVDRRDMRVSNDERQAVVDQLIHHWSDGRLDEPTFDQRAAQARAAVTRGDLDGLLHDLPPLHPAAVATDAAPPRRRPAVWWAVAFFLMLAVASTSLHVLHHVIDPGPTWLLVLLFMWLVIGRRPRRYRRH